MTVVRGSMGAVFTSSSNPTLNIAVAADDNYAIVYVGGPGVSTHATFGIQSVTLGGVAMTRRYTDPGGSGLTAVEAYELFNPTVGASVAVVATRAASGSAPTGIVVRTYKGVQAGAKTFTRFSLVSPSSAAYTRSTTIVAATADDMTESFANATNNFSVFDITPGFQTLDQTFTDGNSNEYRVGIQYGPGTITHSWDADADSTSRPAYALCVTLDAIPTAASKMAITVQPPASAIVGATFSVTAEAQSPSGVKDASYVASCTIAIQTGTGTLAGTVTKAATAGVVTFNNLSMATLQTGLILRVTSGALTGANTTPMDIVAGAAGGGGVFQSGIFD